MVRGLVGARFREHPDPQTAVVRAEDRTHPATEHLGATWTRFDEWYDYRTNPRSDVHVLATVDESTYEGGGMGPDHPIAWCHSYGGGRAFYTGMGHTAESYAEPEFRAHLLGGLRWAASPTRADHEPGPIMVSHDRTGSHDQRGAGRRKVTSRVSPRQVTEVRAGCVRATTAPSRRTRKRGGPAAARHLGVGASKTTRSAGPPDAEP